MNPPIVDVGILTIRDDEFRAVLNAFEHDHDIYKSRHREYTLRTANAGQGGRYSLAILRQIEQGNGEAQDAARDLIDDLQPSLLIVVGIAGGLPSDDISLGDVVLSTRVHDFSTEARKFQEPTTYNIGGGPIVKAIAAGIANLSARESELGDWWAALPVKPTVRVAARNLYGPGNWQRDVRQKLQVHHGKKAANRNPTFAAGPIASSDRLIKDPKVLFPWIKSARGILAIEMESAGVHRATRDGTPMLSIRSLSDIVGLKRQEAWTKYACCSAAAFTRAYLQTRPVRIRELERPKTVSVLKLRKSVLLREAESFSHEETIRSGGEQLYNDLIAENFISCSVEAPYTVRKLIEEIALHSNKPIPIESMNATFAEETAPRGHTFYGNPGDFLEQILSAHPGVHWWISNKGLNIRDERSDHAIAKQGPGPSEDETRQTGNARSAAIIPADLALGRTHLRMNEPACKVREAISQVIEGWSTPLLGLPLIELRAVTVEKDKNNREILALASIGNLLKQGKRIMLEAPPGGGKTTTLIQLSTSPGVSDCITFLIDLPSWLGSGLDLLDYIASRQAFRSRALSADAISQLHNDEQFLFLLNGWNEITESDSPNAVRLLRDLDDNFPKAGIAVATRTHHMIPPLRGAIRLELLRVSRLARARYLEERLAERAPVLRSKLDNDPVLDELTQTPLILSEVTALFEAEVAIPDSKMGVLRTAAHLHERAEQHASHLERPPLTGRAHVYLSELAEVMTEKGAVSLSDDLARGVVNSVMNRLITAGQVLAEAEPSTILHTLCGHHILVNSDDQPVSYRFVHQQFQELYVASMLSERLLALTESGDPQGVLAFTKHFVNELPWAEPLRMIAESIGTDRSQDAGNTIVGAMLIEMALKCDPVYAAELAYLCGPEVWKKVEKPLSERLRSLYKSPAQPDRERAFAGMLASGSADFKDIVLDLLTSTDEQVRLGSYRSWRDFHLSSLGENWAEIVKQWTEERRAEFISELIHFGNAARTLIPYALADDSIKVRVAALSALAWVTPPEEAALRLAPLNDETFNALMADYPAEWLHSSIQPRALEAYWRLYRESSDAAQMLGLLLKIAELGDAAAADEMKTALILLDLARVRDLAQYLIKPVIEIIHKKDPHWVSAWVARHIFDHLLRDEHWLIYVSEAPKDLNEELWQSLEKTNHSYAGMPGSIPMLVKFADSALVQRLFARLCQLREVLANAPNHGHEQESAIERQLQRVFAQLPAELAIRGLSAELHQEIKNIELAVIIGMLSRVGQHGPDDFRGSLTEASRQMLRAYLIRAVPVVLQWQDASGRHLADLASALSRVGEPEDIGLVRQLIRVDIERMRMQRAAFAHSIRRPTDKKTTR